LTTVRQRRRARRVVYEWERPRLYPKQEAAIFEDARYSIIEASTKSGKTVGCIAWMVEQAMLGPGRGANYWWVAPVFGQAKIAYRRLIAGLPEHVHRRNETELWVSLANGSKIWFKSGEKPDNLYGEDVFAAVIDEATRLRQEAWWAVRSTLSATRGPVRIIGNVKGRKNWAYTLARKAELGAANMAFHKIVAADVVDAGFLDQEEVDDAQATLPAHVFAELYKAEPSDDGGNPFGIKDIASNIVPNLSPLPPVAIGIDLAKSVDWTVICGLDEHGSVSLLNRFRTNWEATTKTILTVTGAKWHWSIEDEDFETDLSIPVLVDATGVGDPILERLQVAGRTAAQFSRFEGFKFSPSSKQQLMEDLSVAIQSHEISYPDEPFVLVPELNMFEYEYYRNGVRYTAPEGFHDDAVDALALAVRARRTAAGRKPNVRWL
jgi:hypothetical protein